MTESLARRERAALCDLALEVGPEAPTLCAGWTSRDLVVHLLLRERHPLAAAGIMLPPLARFTERASRATATRDYDALVGRLRTPGGMFALPPVDRLANTFEYLVHHEDLRRGAPGWAPRQLDPTDLETTWSQLRRGIAFIGRRLPVPTVLRRADTGAAVVARKGAAPVTVSGDVVDLVLFLFGRSAAQVDLDGPEAAVAALRAADLSA